MEIRVTVECFNAVEASEHDDFAISMATASTRPSSLDDENCGSTNSLFLVPQMQHKVIRQD